MAKKSKADRLVITLECTECRERNYTTEKNRRNDPSRLELREILPTLPLCTSAPRNSVARRRADHEQSRVVAQLVEQRSPKPQVAGSIPAGPAISQQIREVASAASV